MPRQQNITSRDKILGATSATSSNITTRGEIPAGTYATSTNIMTYDKILAGTSTTSEHLAANFDKSRGFNFSRHIMVPRQHSSLHQVPCQHPP